MATAPSGVMRPCDEVASMARFWPAIAADSEGDGEGEGVDERVPGEATGAEVAAGVVWRSASVVS